MQKYIEMLDCEIDRLVRAEIQRGRLNMGFEQLIHLLSENRKNAMKRMEAHQQNPGHVPPAAKPPGAPG